MKRIAFVTYRELPRSTDDDGLALEPLRRLGFAVESIVWDDWSVNFSKLDGLVLRSCWDDLKVRGVFELARADGSARRSGRETATFEFSSNTQSCESAQVFPVTDQDGVPLTLLASGSNRSPRPPVLTPHDCIKLNGRIERTTGWSRIRSRWRKSVAHQLGFLLVIQEKGETTNQAVDELLDDRSRLSLPFELLHGACSSSQASRRSACGRAGVIEAAPPITRVTAT